MGHVFTAGTNLRLLTMHDSHISLHADLGGDSRIDAVNVTW